MLHAIGHKSSLDREIVVPTISNKIAGGASTADASGHGKTWSVNGGAAWSTGQTGNAASLDGTNDHITLPAGVVSDADTIRI
jgi:hypothetical protein